MKGIARRVDPGEKDGKKSKIWNARMVWKLLSKADIKAAVNAKRGKEPGLAPIGIWQTVEKSMWNALSKEKVEEFTALAETWNQKTPEEIQHRYEA